MNQDELLIQLCQSLIRDPGVTAQAEWQKLIIVGQAGDAHSRMSGYCFDLTGKGQPVAPGSDEPLELLEQLRSTMKADSPTGRPWQVCLLRIGRNGEVGVDFEYADASRWAVTPANRTARAQEFAAMPV